MPSSPTVGPTSSASSTSRRMRRCGRSPSARHRTGWLSARASETRLRGHARESAHGARRARRQVLTSLFAIDRRSCSLGAMAKRRVLALLLGLVAFVLAGASLPHLHASRDFGLWNEEHDLSLLAALGTAASQPDATPVMALELA